MQGKRKNIQEILTASQYDNKLFHKLINKQRKTVNKDVKLLKVKGQDIQGQQEILHAWNDHFESLATPDELELANHQKIQLAKEQNSLIEEDIQLRKEAIQPVTKEDVIKAIDSLNCGKAADQNGLSNEHFKYAKLQLAPVLTQIINNIFEEVDVPESLKCRILNPVHMKGKDKFIAGNYRGIVISDSFTKILECILKTTLDRIFDCQQNSLQRGFTAGSSSVNAADIVSEAINFHKSCKIPLLFATLDAQKAFDRVNHEIFNKLYHIGLQGPLWLLMRNLYRQSSVKVKSPQFELKQGTKQGAQLSTTLYKIYHNHLLDSLTKSGPGASVGNIGVPGLQLAPMIQLC